MPPEPPPADDADLIPLSALQHYLFCPRQCALIHVERLWAENCSPPRGASCTSGATSPGRRAAARARIVQSMPLRSRALGVAGVADVVELPATARRWRPFPVEYKRGRPKAHRADEVQLCAQALCLEEMFAVPVPEGALFYGKMRRRHVVAFDDELRALTRDGRRGDPRPDRRRPHAAAGLRGASAATPARSSSSAGRSALARPGPVAAWLRRRIEEAEPPAETTA